MDRVFFTGLAIGMISRLIMLNLDQKQYPAQPNILLSQLVLAFVASSLGALLVPALINRSYTSITFLSLAAEQFRQVRENRRNTLQNLEDVQLVKRGEAFIEEIARTYEVRNYMCITTSLITVGMYYIIISETNIGKTISLVISGVSGLALTFMLKRLLRRESIGDIADVVEAKISFVDGSIMQIGDLKGITNIGLESDRKRYLTKGIGIEIIPKDKSYTNAGILYDPGQRQAILYNIYSRLGLLREHNEPAFVPLPRRNPKNESIMIAYIPIEKDIDKVIEAVKSCPILSSAKGKNLSLKNYTIGKKGSM
ncbi:MULTISPECIES: YIEGIA family protein [Clostridia]|uniref:YIEGIA family protein n=1 Tax=Clostridium sp. CCUG 7971 TaxID=2811414 RepID=UPI001ABBC023|nr:YIEGIA family protein [Clostridium sp. CCUG 7971]MBO3443287.1 YIEGIA family protein [Clostridium sp. CCUG 7971]